MVRQILLFAVLAACGAVVGYVVRGVQPRPILGGTAPVPDSPEEGAGLILALGRIQPSGGLVEIAGPPGIRLAEIPVAEGDWVEQGAILAVLEGRAEQMHQVAMIEAEIREAEAQLRAEDENAEVLDQELAIRREEVERIDPLDIRSQRASIDILEHRRRQVETDLGRMSGLHDKAIVSRQELEQQQLLLERTGAEQASARIVLEKMEQAHRIKKDQLEIEARKARLAVDRARRAIGLESLRSSLDLARDRLEQTLIKAPTAGRVLRLLARPGEMLGARPILHLGDTRRMEVIAEVYEDSREDVEVGQAASISSPALPGPIEGEVASIGWMIAKNDILGLDPASAAYARVVEVRIALEPGDAGRREAVEHLTNLQVDVEIRRDGPINRPD